MAKITLTITEGKFKGKKFVFSEPTTCTMGRSEKCNPRLPDDEEHKLVSRYHCSLEINPPRISIRDLGSRNGTYVNGKKIGQRSRNLSSTEADQVSFSSHKLNKGDEIKLGNTVFKVDIEVNAKIEKNKNQSVGEVGENNLPRPSRRSSRVARTNSTWYDSPNFLSVTQRLLEQAVAGDPNLTVLRDYSLHRKLGQERFSEIYLVRHQRTREFLTLKIKIPAIQAGIYTINKLLQEVEKTKSLNHPHIVQLLDCGYASPAFFFILQYCHESTLVDLIQRGGGPLYIDQAIEIIFQILDALEYAHNTGISIKNDDGSVELQVGLIHRCIKPSSILFTNVGQKRIVKIGDYGISAAFDLAGLSGFSLQSKNIKSRLEFMPRQQVINPEYAQPDLDVWGAAAILYYMLAGTSPRNFHGQDPSKVALQTAPISILQRNRNIPRRLAQAIDLALIDNPNIVYKSPREFKQALESML